MYICASIHIYNICDKIFICLSGLRAYHLSFICPTSEQEYTILILYHCFGINDLTPSARSLRNFILMEIKTEMLEVRKSTSLDIFVN